MIPRAALERQSKYKLICGISLTDINIVSRAATIYKTEFGLTTGFTGSHYSYTKLRCIHFATHNN
jgi:hypothetical protein